MSLSRGALAVSPLIGRRSRWASRDSSAAYMDQYINVNTCVILPAQSSRAHSGGKRIFSSISPGTRTVLNSPQDPVERQRTCPVATRQDKTRTKKHDRRVTTPSSKHRSTTTRKAPIRRPASCTRVTQQHPGPSPPPLRPRYDERRTAFMALQPSPFARPVWFA